MAVSKRSRQGKSTPDPKHGSGIPRPWSEFLGIALVAFAVLMTGGLVSYHGGDGSLMGPVGYGIAASTYATFGMASYLVALGVLAIGGKALLGHGMELRLGEAFGFSLATLAGCVLLHVMFPDYRVHGYTSGGLSGELLGEVSLGLFHHAGTYLVALALLVVGLLASTPLSVEHLVAGGRFAIAGVQAVARYLGHGFVELVRSQRDPGPLEDEADDREDDAREDDALEDEEEDDAGEEPSADEETRARKPQRNRRREPSPSEDEDEAEGEDVEGEEDAEDEDAEDEGEDEDAEDEAEDDDGGVSDEEPEIVVFDEGGEGETPRSSGTTGKAARSSRSGTGKDAPGEGTGKDVVREISSHTTPAREGVAREGKAAAPRRSEPAIPGVVRLTSGPYELPPLQMFEAVDKVENEFDRAFVLDQAQRLVTALGEFRIRGKVTKIHPGPVITRYEFKPEPGVKLSKIESLENDIAMALEAISIRLLAPIPGKATVGFEVPNNTRETVYVKEILAQEAFGKGKKLPLALGKDITGTITTIDLAKAPHLLVAGATGSGKSVGVNAMICSLLYACTPEDVRMIMIDPKMLELSIYEGIPHLLLPVVTDPEKAALALRWAVEEMERRYALLSTAQVRDIASYNKKLPELVQQWEADVRAAELVANEAQAEATLHGEDAVPGSALPGTMIDAEGRMSASQGGAAMPERPGKLPYVVVIIDEFADLMMVASKEVEQCVARIAAKARAAGIHLIVATQRPSVDVITGTIKNNFPSRIAFQVTSEADSRTILDGKGAKQLLGMGDMLYMDRGMVAKRVHGCYVSEDEILKVVQFVKRQARPVYNMDIVRRPEDTGEGEPEQDLDPLYDRAVEIVAEAQKVSTSMLQRRLGIGYNRAARIVEAMEERGVIGPARGTTPREVFVSAA